MLVYLLALLQDSFPTFGAAAAASRRLNGSQSIVILHGLTCWVIKLAHFLLLHMPEQ